MYVIIVISMEIWYFHDIVRVKYEWRIITVVDESV